MNEDGHLRKILERFEVSGDKIFYKTPTNLKAEHFENSLNKLAIAANSTGSKSHRYYVLYKATDTKYLKGGNCIPNQKLACFALYLKIVNTFLKNNASYSKLSKEVKNSIKI